MELSVVDILAIGVHPDDVELSCSGTLLSHAEKGLTFGILDLTRGEMGTRGSEEIRKQEALEAAKILGSHFRENVGIADGFFELNSETAALLIPYIRAAKPQIVLANALDDRHPDHGRAANLIHDACFLSGLSKIKTKHPITGSDQERHRPNAIYHYQQDYSFTPDIVVDIGNHLDKKMEAVLAFKSQFHHTDQENYSENLPTPISGVDFIEYVKSKARVMGRFVGCEYGEGFHVKRPIGVTNLEGMF